jgi:CheY-like chemotaxis protein
MGGVIRVDSTPGNGSTFHFSIPIVLVSRAVSNEKLGVTPPLENFVLGQRCPLSVLLAEDNKVNQQVVSLMLNRLGYDAVIVANGLEAVQTLERKSFDLILMDIQMPVMSGIEATEKIIRENPLGRPQIIALTANASKEDRSHCLAVGMDDYMVKPLRLDRLALALEESYMRKQALKPTQ